MENKMEREIIFIRKRKLSIRAHGRKGKRMGLENL
jgi:hypothetical protein